MKYLFLLILLLFGGQATLANSVETVEQGITIASDKPGRPKLHKLRQFVNKLRAKAKNDKLVLAGLTITLGIFGVHRLYLGTSPHVPVIYTVTLGGGLGIVPLIDLIHILATKDLEKYQEIHRFFMWGGKNLEGG